MTDSESLMIVMTMLFALAIYFQGFCIMRDISKIRRDILNLSIIVCSESVAKLKEKYGLK